jgi:hypothetical protein
LQGQAKFSQIGIFGMKNLATLAERDIFSSEICAQHFEVNHLPKRLIRTLLEFSNLSSAASILLKRFFTSKLRREISQQSCGDSEGFLPKALGFSLKVASFYAEPEASFLKRS